MRSGRRAGWTLGLFAVLFAAWPECSVSAPAKQQAALLLSSPTPALVQEVESEHQPTSQETAVVAVFWASVLQAQQTGSAPEIWYATDILSVVASLGGEYPALFATGGDGGLAPLSGDLRLRGSSPQLESPVAPPARSCHQTCLAASPWAYESLAENVISALAPFGSSAKVAADAVTVWDAVTAVGFRTHSIITLVMDLPEATTLPLVLDIGDVVLGTAGLLTLGTAAAPAIATAGAAWAAIEIGISLADAVSG